MATAIIAAAQWIGMTVFQAATAAGASITAASTLANVAVAASAVAAVVGVAEVSQALQPKIGGNFGTQVDFKADPRAGIPYAVGRTGLAGNIVFAQTAGAKNSYLNYCVVLTGAGPVEEIESFSVNGTPVTFGSDGGQGAYGYYLNRMWWTSQLGESPESSYLHLTATGSKDTPGDHGGMPSEWTSAHKLSGYAAFFWGLQFNTDKYSAGTPKPLAVGKWVKVYDPRLDSTYPGGSGPQRALDEDTYAWSENPYLHALTWCLGRWQNGKRVAGVGAPIAMIDVAAFVEGANVADANSWVCGGVAYSTDDKWEVLKAFLQAGGGKPMRLGAKISCLVNTPRVSLATLTGDDVVGDVAITATQSRRSRINTIWPKYRDENQGWEMVTADEPVAVSAYVTADGQPRSKEIEYALVQNVDQAAQLARYDIEDSREFTPCTFPCKPRWMGYKPGDCITVDEPEYGLNGQKMLILQRRRDPATMVTTLVCRSETDGKHAFALGETGTPPSTPGLTGVDSNAVNAPGATAFDLAGLTLTSGDVTLPGLVVTGEADNSNAAEILIRYRPSGATDWAYWASVPAASTRIEISGVTPDTVYEAEVAYRTIRGAVSAWTSLGTAAAGVFDPGVAGSDIPSPNLWRKQDYVASGSASAIDPAFGVSNWGFRFTGSAAGAATVTRGGFGLHVAPDFARYSFAFRHKLTTGAGTATVRVGFRTSGGAAIAGLADQVVTVSTTEGYFTWNNITSTDAGFPTAKLVIFVNAGDVAAGKNADIGDIILVYGDTAPAGFAPSPDDPAGLTLAGAGTLATQNDVTWATQVTGSGKPADNATKNVVYRQNSAPSSPTTNDIWCQLDGVGNPIAIWVYNGSSWINGADRTVYNTAAAITGQGAWATASVPGGLTPTTVNGRTQYFDSSGQLYDYRGVLWGYSVDGVAGRGVQPISTGVGSVSISSHTINFPTSGGFTSVSVPSHSESGLSNDTNYTAFYRPAFGTWFIVQSIFAPAFKASIDNYLYIGEFRTPLSGGTYTAPTTDYNTNGVWDELCVSADAVLASGQRAGDARPGDALTLMAPSGDFMLEGEVEANVVGKARGLRLTTALGAVLTVSDTAPIMTRHAPGGLPYPVRAADVAVGLAVPTCHSEDPSGEVVWDELASVEPVGEIEVAKIAAKGVGIYAASDIAGGPFLLTHNRYSKV